MELTILQILLVTLYAFIAINDSLISNTLHQPVIAGMVSGAIMGDVKTGLIVGGTLQLMGLGLAAFGGASIPDYLSGAILGTAFAIVSGQGAEFGVGLAVPVSLLMLQLDVAARFINVFLLHRVDNAIAQKKYERIDRLVLSGSLTWGLSRALPIFIMLVVGSATVTAITNSIPVWLMTGLKVSGGVLPVVGIGILLRYMPTKNYFPYLLAGFFLVAYLQVPMMGIAIIGLVAAMIVFKQGGNKEKSSTVTESNALFEGGIEGDE